MMMMVESIGEVLGTKLPDTYRGQLLNCGPQWDGGKDRVIDLEETLLAESRVCYTYMCKSYKILVSRMIGIGILQSLFKNVKG